MPTPSRPSTAPQISANCLRPPCAEPRTAPKLGRVPSGAGKARAVDLAVGRQRQSLQHERRRHHVLGQALPPDRTQRPAGAGSVPGRPRRRPPGALPPGLSSRATTTASRTAGMLAPATPRSRPARCGSRGSSPGWSSRPRNSISPSGSQPCQVAGPVQPRPGLRERVGHEPLGGQLRAVQVAAAQPGPADVQLSRAPPAAPAAPHGPARTARVLASRRSDRGTVPARSPHSGRGAAVTHMGLGGAIVRYEPATPARSRPQRCSVGRDRSYLAGR